MHEVQAVDPDHELVQPRRAGDEQAEGRSSRKPMGRVSHQGTSMSPKRICRSTRAGASARSARNDTPDHEPDGHEPSMARGERDGPPDRVVDRPPRQVPRRRDGRDQGEREQVRHPDPGADAGIVDRAAQEDDEPDQGEEGQRQQGCGRNFLLVRHGSGSGPGRAARSQPKRKAQLPLGRGPAAYGTARRGHH